ncbi:MAG: hypothetical protein IH621_18915 [Krumholzibacteria bacterium]|nr:hypothetical protein [Candidatus Krumholzibacteria bacterium]
MPREGKTAMNTVGWLLVATAFVLTTGAEARTWRVEKDGSGDYTVIQDALDAAASGDTIQIGPGRFEDFRIYPTNGGDQCQFSPEGRHPFSRDR